MAEIEREELEVDVLFVGAGPGSLAGALRLAQLLEEHEAAGGDTGEMMIAVIEKAAEVGFHAVSGAVMDPRGIAELMPDYRARGCPIEADVVRDEVWYLHETEHDKAPLIPGPLKNLGNHVISLGRLTAWLAEQVEATGRVDIFTETAGTEILYDGDQVVGVRTGDKGVDKDGNPKSILVSLPKRWFWPFEPHQQQLSVWDAVLTRHAPCRTPPRQTHARFRSLRCRKTVGWLRAELRCRARTDPDLRNLLLYMR